MPGHLLIRYHRTVAQALELVYASNPLLTTAQVIIQAGNFENVRGLVVSNALNNTDGQISVVGNANLKTGDILATNGVFDSANGNFTLDSTGNITLLSSHVSALQNVGLHASGKILIDSLQYDSQSTDANGVTRRLRETDQSGISSANGDVTIVGVQSVDIDASNVAALNGTLHIHSDGDVNLGFNTDVDQQNWTTVDVRRSWYGKKTVTTTEHEVTDKTAVVTDLQAKDVVVTGANVYAWGSEITGSESVYVAGKDKTLIYTVDNVKTVTANSNKSSSFLGIGYSNKDSQDSLQDTSALKPTLSSDTVITLGVGNEANLNGTVFNAPTINIIRNPEADPSTQAHLTLGLALDTQVTSHTETAKTLGVWQKQSGEGGTTQTGTAPSFNGNLSIDPSLVVTVRLPEGDLKNQIDALSQQPGMGYLKDLASNPKIKWDQVKLAHDSWSYSQQGLTPAGAALLSIAIAAYTGGMGAELLGGTAGTAATATAAATQATLMGSTALGAAANAGFAALTASAGVSFVNNGGDIGQTLKDLGSKESVKNIALAMVTAGALSELNASLGLDKINAKDSTFGANLGKAVINNLATAGINSALTGTDLEDNIKTALVSAFISAGSGQAANEIGNLTQDSQALKALAHALAGCMAGGASGGKQGCESGAIGAVVGELAAQWYDSPTGSKSPEDVLNFVKVMSAAAGAITGDGSAESVNIAVMTGVNAAQNNYLRHAEAVDLSNANARLMQCTDSACAAKEQQIIDGLLLKSYERDMALQKACSGTGAGSSTCMGLMSDAKQAWASYSGKPSSVFDPVVAEQAAAAKRAYYYPSYAAGGTATPRTTGVINGMLKALGSAAVAPLLITTTAAQALLGDEQALQSLKSMVVDAAVVLTDIPAAVQKQLDAAKAAEARGDTQKAAEIYAELATNTVLVSMAVTKATGGSSVFSKEAVTLTPAEAANVAIGNSLGKAGKTFDAVTPGPLADNLAATFAGGKYTEVTLTKNAVMYRAGSGDAALGQFFVNEPPKGIIQSRVDSAILPNWPGGGASPIDSVFEAKIPAGTKIYIGTAGTQGGFYVGGTPQIVIVRPWTIPGVVSNPIGVLK